MADESSVRCDVFELEASVKDLSTNPILCYRFWTDLPAGTIVGLSCSRRYLDLSGDSCLWSMIQDGLLVQPKVYGDFCGGRGEIDVNSSDAEGRKEFDDLLGEFSSGIASPVGAEVHLVLSVGARQRLRAFGKNNRSLCGAMVFDAGGINCVQVEATLNVPMADKYQPIDQELSCPQVFPHLPM